MQFRTLVALVLALAMMAAGCASIMHGTKQSVGISSVPTDAQVTVDGVELGRTPVIGELSRKEQHFVTIELDGYMPYETTLTKNVSGWVWGNIIFGGVIGLAVDAITGGLYNLTPEQIEAELREQLSEGVEFDDGLFVVAVLTPDPSWERIGTLQPRTNE